MLVGLGIDLQIHCEMELSLDDPFMMKCFTEGERAEAAGRSNRPRYLAGRFAVKEATVKAFGIDTDHVRLSDIETLSDEHGVPRLRLHGSLAKIAVARGIADPLVSISHASKMSTAVVALQTMDAATPR